MNSKEEITISFEGQEVTITIEYADPTLYTIEGKELSTIFKEFVTPDVIYDEDEIAVLCRLPEFNKAPIVTYSVGTNELFNKIEHFYGKTPLGKKLKANKLRANNMANSLNVLIQYFMPVVEACDQLREVFDLYEILKHAYHNEDFQLNQKLQVVHRMEQLFLDMAKSMVK